MTQLRKPDFLIIGAQKCGTSWLHHHLRQSEGVFMPEDKDVEQFTYVGNLNDQAFETYLQRFTAADDQEMIGDANAGYFWTETGSEWNRKPESFNLEIPQSVRTYCGPDLKLIVMLRDPVERAVSAYLHHYRHGALTLDDSILDPRLPLGIIDMGFYQTHLANWGEFYPDSQIHLINTMPDSAESAVEIMRSVCQFLGVRCIRPEQYYLKKVFPGLARREDARGIWVSSRGCIADETSALDDQFELAISFDELDQIRALYAQGMT